MFVCCRQRLLLVKLMMAVIMLCVTIISPIIQIWQPSLHSIMHLLLSFYRIIWKSTILLQIFGVVLYLVFRFCWRCHPCELSCMPSSLSIKGSPSCGLSPTGCIAPFADATTPSAYASILFTFIVAPNDLKSAIRGRCIFVFLSICSLHPFGNENPSLHPLHSLHLTIVLRSSYSSHPPLLISRIRHSPPLPFVDWDSVFYPAISSVRHFPNRFHHCCSHWLHWIVGLLHRRDRVCSLVFIVFAEGVVREKNAVDNGGLRLELLLCVGGHECCAAIAAV
mmetsp:Transcript_10262/g.16783  ORF Transcript_10262/g.16783 Transcript_10262/m.16783 type:complete len:279 (+) Transcript_10262:509-1345(+)